VLTIGKLTPGRAAYYVEQLPGRQDEYYTADGHGDGGVWTGSAATLLGLDGVVNPDDFRRVLDACHPASGGPLGVPRTTGLRLAGFDLCISAPKSVSVAWALGPREVANAVVAAHDRAVDQVVAALEVEVVRARRGAGGSQVIDTDGVVAAAFAHRTSRAGDPQIHSHVVVANLTPDKTGRWTAIDGSRVFRWAKTLGFLYQASLRAELSQVLGMRWAPVQKGAADLAGMDREAIEAFSKRTAQIVAVTGGAHVSLAAAKTATLATRAPKASVPDLDSLRQRWQHEAADLGLDAAAIVGLTGPRTLADLHVDALLPVLLGPTGLTAQASSFDRRDVLQALAAASPSGASSASLLTAADRVLAHPDVIPLAADRPAGPRYSTTELLAVETAMLERARNRRDAGLAVAQPQLLDQVVSQRPSLSDEQRRMVSTLVNSGSGVEMVVGRGGAGKTFALDAARAAWDLSGYHVIGAALAARAAAELQAGAGIPATTLDHLLADLDRPGPLAGLAPGTVVVVDEAAMIGTRKLARLLDHAAHDGAKVVLVGDYRQLPEIDAGGAFAALSEAVPTVELVDNRRQRHAWERAALDQLRSGSVTESFAAYRAAGRVTVASGADAAREAMVADWWLARQTGLDAAMYALRRADVDDLNYRARRHLDAVGLLGSERLTIASREFAVGDGVLCLRNDRRLGVRNGTLAAVARVDLAAGEVTLTDGTRLPRDYLAAGHLAHSYATTIHKSQGATVDRAFLLGSEGLYREAGYVGLSRARQGTDLYIVGPPPGVEVETDPVVRTIRHLAESKAQTMAAEQLQRRAVLVDPAPWLIQALGPPPVSGRDRTVWAQRAERLAVYHDIYDVTDTRHPIGPRPDEPNQRRAWELARLTIVEHHRGRGLDHGLEL
jgi:conjugative relaxase-like TrwC/TraI family protein